MVFSTRRRPPQIDGTRLIGLAVLLMFVFAFAAAGLFAKDLKPPSDDRPVKSQPATSAAKPTIKTSPVDETDSSVLLLQKFGVTPDARSLGAYLKSMLPDSEARKTQASLINQLGDDDYHKRESAMKSLQKLPVISAELLKLAVAGPDPEIRWRAGRILESANRRSGEILHAAFDVIAKRRIPGLVPEILATMPLCSEDVLLGAAGRALEASATRDDAERLKSQIADKTNPLRAACLRAFAGALKKDADAELTRLLKDPDHAIQVESARGLISHGNRDALPELVRLLSSDNLTTRVQAVKILRAVSGQRFGFIAYETDDKRKAATLKWREWVAGNGQTVALKLPLRESAVELGRTLICNYNQNKVIELDAAGKPVWEHTVGTHPWACQGLPNGHRLVACYTTKTVTEYDAKGKIAWAKSSLPGGPTGVERLENGNTLVACTDSHKVIEYDRSGTAVWQASISQRPTDADRLENGNTLITLQSGGRVVEVDRAGKVVFEITGLSSPFSSQRLANGHTIVTCVGNGSVLEYDASGKKVVWSQTGLRSPYEAQRLANGNTLISDQTGIREFGRDGKVQWTYPMSGVSKFHRY